MPNRSREFWVMLRSITTAAANPPSVRIPITTPFTSSSLSTIRTTLANAHAGPNIRDAGESHAAVLIPLCNVNGQPGVLLEVRGQLRTHSGEVSFPGGKLDETDATCWAAALRETQEELGIEPQQVEILGRIGPPEKSLKGLRVWPYVGFVHAEPQTIRPRGRSQSSEPLSSLSLSTLRLSPAEVAHAFHLPMTGLFSPPRLHNYLFRGERPYFAISVADLVAGPNAVHSATENLPHFSDPQQRDEIGGGREGRLEVWGLTVHLDCAHRMKRGADAVSAGVMMSMDSVRYAFDSCDGLEVLRRTYGLSAFILNGLEPCTRRRSISGASLDVA
ncbi:NUDIX hydrolase domain-like protein [Fomitopsis betulina]|nr:NUDIX hydrolase domain-like protein [Fomitopsis betulina]